jgi:hypothetical protein
MAGFTIYITPVVTADGLEHTATSWQIASDPEFKNLLVDDQKDEDNLLSLKVDLTLTRETIYYSRHKLHFGDDKETNWSRPTIITKDGDGFSFNNTIITTPKVYSETGNIDTPLGGFKFFTDPFNLFMGVGKHLSTDWIIEDSEGNIVWQRLDDKNNLTEIRLPKDILEPGKLYVIKVRFKSDTNAISNFGKFVFTTNPKLAKITIGGNNEVGTTDVNYLLQRLEYLENIEDTAKDLLDKLVATTIECSLK